MTALAGQRRSFVEQHGSHCLAYSTLQPGLDYFDTSKGFVAYRRVKVLWQEHWTVLGDPVCAAADLRDLVAEFMRSMAEYSSRVRCSFWQVGEATARILREHGLIVNSLGYEVSVNLHCPPEDGRRPWSFLKRTARGAAVDGAALREAAWDAALPEALRAVSDIWLRSQIHKRELSFLTRPLSQHPEPGVRVFVAENLGGLQAFAVFDPVYERGQVVGYYAQSLRARTGAQRWRSALVHHAAECFTLEGSVQRLELGICPCAVSQGELDSEHGRVSRLTCLLLRRFGRLYNFRGLEEHKNRYLGGMGVQATSRGKRLSVYFAVGSRVPGMELLALLRSMGISWDHRAMLPSRATLSVVFGVVCLSISVLRRLQVVYEKGPQFLLFSQLQPATSGDADAVAILSATAAGFFGLLFFLYNYLKHINDVRDRVLKISPRSQRETDVRTLFNDWSQFILVIPFVLLVAIDMLLCAEVTVGPRHDALPCVLWYFTCLLLLFYIIIVPSEIRSFKGRCAP